MPFFDDMTTALETYPVTDVKLEIVDVTFAGSTLNVDEIATFKVKVTNTGPLNLTGVTVRVTGLNGASVKGSGAAEQFASVRVSETLPTIYGHGGSQLTPFNLYFKAPSEPQVSKNLIKATLETWDANLDHILLGHSDPLDSPKGTYSTAVIAS